MKTREIPLAAAIVACALTACGSVQIDLKDGTARIEQCPGVVFRIIVAQGPIQRNARAAAEGETVRFESSDFDDIDFSRPMTIRVFADTIPPGGEECPIEAGTVYILRDTIPDRIGDDVYEIDLGDFTME